MNSLQGVMSTGGEQMAIETVGASQVLRLQERLDRQIASMKREIVATMEQTVEDMVQERTQMVRSQILVNHATLQKDVVGLQTALSDLRLHTVAAGQDAEEQRRAVGAAMEEVRKLSDGMQREIAELSVRVKDDTSSLALRLEANETMVSDVQAFMRVQADARERCDGLCAELRAECSRFSSASHLDMTSLRKELSELTTRMQACDNLCKRCLGALDTSLGEVRRDFTVLLEDMHCERDRSRLELGGRVGLAEAEIYRRIEEASAACKEVSIGEMRAEIQGLVGNAQRQVEQQVESMHEQATRLVCDIRMLEEAHQQLERGSHEQSEILQKKLFESLENTACQVGIAEACQQEATKSLVEDVAARLSRRLEESLLWAEATAGASQEVFGAELHAMEDRLESRQADQRREATVQLESISGAVRHLEQATAWALQKVDDSKERAASDFRACTVQQEDGMERWHELKETVSKVQMAHLSLEGRQATMERWNRAWDESQCRQQDCAKKSIEDLTIELRSARGDWERQLSATQQSLDAVLAEVGARIPRARHERQERQADKAAEAAIEAAVAAAAAEERASMASRSWETAQKQHEDVMGRLSEGIQLCVYEQQVQDRRCEDLWQKVSRLENESVVAIEQVRQDSAQRLANFRSQTRDDYAALEKRLHACSASQEDLTHRHHGLCTQFETSETRIMAEHQHLVSELGVSEASLLADQRAVLTQVHDLAKAQEGRMQRHVAKSNHRHEEATQGLQSLRMEVVEATKQLVEGLFTEQSSIIVEQSSAIAKFHNELREVESHAVQKGQCAGEAAVQKLSRELHSEMEAAQDLWQHLATSQDADMQQLHASFKSSLRSNEEMELRTTSELADRHSRVVQELQSFDFRIKEELMVEVRACQEASESIMHRSLLDCASLERAMLTQNNALKDQASVAEESFRAIARGLHSEALEEVMATQFNCKASVESVRGEILEEVLAMDDNCRTIVKSLRREMLDEFATTQSNHRTDAESLRKEFSNQVASSEKAMARLESISSGSAIAAAAASAAVEVRNEVLSELNNLQEQMKATDEQLLFLRAELAPDVLCGVLKRDLAGSLEQISSEQLSRFRRRWGGDVERKLECIVQCLQSLHLKVGVPLRGSLASMLPPARHGVEFEDLT